MTYSDKVDSVSRIIRAFYAKKGRWPQHAEVLEYLILAHSVKQATALAYVKQAFDSGKIKDMVSHLEVRE